MKTHKILYTIAIACFILTSCQKDIKKENVSLAISGMTCEIGCAKTIQSKLSKKEGVLDAKVIFNDSIANIEFDANTTSKKELIAFVSGIAGGELYSASESSKKSHSCSADCKDKSELKSDKKSCCSGKTENGEMICNEDCKMVCCAQKTS